VVLRYKDVVKTGGRIGKGQAAEGQISGVEVTGHINIGGRVHGNAQSGLEVIPAGAFGPQDVARTVIFGHEDVLGARAEVGEGHAAEGGRGGGKAARHIDIARHVHGDG